MSKFALIKAAYTEDLPVLYGRNLETNQKNSFLIPNFKPFFFVEDETHGQYTSIEGKKLRKITVDKPYNVPEERSKYPKTWQADIPYARNYLICSGIRNGFEVDGTNVKAVDVEYKPYILYTDIEAYPSGDEPNKQKDFITAVSLGDNEQDAIISIVVGIDAEDEKDLLNKLAKILTRAEPDCIVSWSDYDYEMLKARFAVNNIDFSFNDVNYFDLLAASRILFNKASYRLKDIAYEEGITTEKQPSLDYRELFDKDKEELGRINVTHTRWLRDFNKKHKIVEYHWQLKQFTGLESLENTLYASVLIDTLLLREYHDKYILPTKEWHERVPYEGAIVLEPKKGIFQGVAVFDMAHFYPSVIESENLSPEIYYGVGAGEGILPQLSKKLMSMRNELKEQHPLKYMTVKAIHNALYGVLASSNFRLFIPEIAAKITEKAREGLKFIIDKTEQKGYNIIFGDTDSVAVEMDKGEAEQLLNYLNNELKNFGEGYELKLEKYFTKYCSLGQKKRYFGSVEGRDRLEIKGFEEVRADSSRLTKKVQQDIMEMALDEDRQGIVDYLKKIVKDFDDYSPEEIAIPKGLSRNLDEYKVDVDYIRGAKWIKSKYKVDMKAGDRVYFIYSLRPTTIITVPDLEMFKKIDGLEVDKHRMMERVVIKPTKELIEILGLSWQEIKGQGRLL